MESRTLTPRHARWTALLSAFNFSMLHLPETANLADPASRSPDFIEGSQGEKALVLFESVKNAEMGVSSIKMDPNEIQFDITFAKPTPDTLSFIQAG